MSAPDPMAPVLRLVHGVPESPPVAKRVARPAVENNWRVAGRKFLFAAINGADPEDLKFLAREFYAARAVLLAELGGELP